MDDFMKEIDEAVKEVAEDLLKEMKGIVHVRSGNLRDSLSIEKQGEMSYNVGVDADTLKGDSRNKNGYDYSIPYYYGKPGTSWGGHKFLEIAMNKVGGK